MSESWHRIEVRILERLERLGELKTEGILTTTEFRAERKRVLADVAVEKVEATKRSRPTGIDRS